MSILKSTPNHAPPKYRCPFKISNRTRPTYPGMNSCHLWCSTLVTAGLVLIETIYGAGTMEQLSLAVNWLTLCWWVLLADDVQEYCICRGLQICDWKWKIRRSLQTVMMQFSSFFVLLSGPSTWEEGYFSMWFWFRHHYRILVVCSTLGTVKGKVQTIMSSLHMQEVVGLYLFLDLCSPKHLTKSVLHFLTSRNWSVEAEMLS